MKRAFLVAAGFSFAAWSLSCNLDPVHKTAVSFLGPEDPADGPPETKYHRPGQPCVLCHSDNGPADTKFLLGGTVYWGPDDPTKRVDNAYVRVVDGNHGKHCWVTNCNGNFYVQPSELISLTFPLLVSVERTNGPGTPDESTKVIRRMSGHIGREPSCANCHQLLFHDFASPGVIHLYDREAEVEAAGVTTVECPPPPDYVEVAKCPEDR